MGRYLLIGMLLLGLLAAWPGLAQQELKVTLKFTPVADEKWQDALNADLLDAALQGQSLGINGFASAKTETVIVAVDADKKLASLKTTFSELKSLLNGQSSSPRTPAPMVYKLDQAGQLMEVEQTQQAGAAVDFMDTGGVPLQLVALLARLVRFSDQPVGVGDTWDIEDRYKVPGLGEIPINTRWTIDEVTDKAVYISSKATAVLPPFVTPNPMAPGSTMEVRGGRAYLTSLKQVYDLEHSRVMEAEGNLKIEAMLTMQGMQMPIALTVRFNSKPVEKPAEPAN